MPDGPAAPADPDAEPEPERDEERTRRWPVALAIFAVVFLVPALGVVVGATRGGEGRAKVNFAADPPVLTAADSSCIADAPATPGTTVPRDPSVPLAFVDVTRDAGLCVRQHDYHLPPDCFFNEPGDVPGSSINEAGDLFAKCLEERMSGGAAVGDYDHDGHVDVYLTQLRQGAPGRLFHNDGTGHFTDVTHDLGLDAVDANGNGAAWVDVDGDGRLDLVVTTLASDRYLLFHQGADGRFTEEGRQRGVALDDGKERRGFSIAVGDYDGDGYPDLFLTEWLGAYDWGIRTSTHARLLHNRGAAAPGTFEDVTDRAGVALGDPKVVRAQHEIERGLAPDIRRTASFAAAFVDLDGDHRPDLVVASDFGTSQLFWNNGDGTFTEGTDAAGVGKEGNAMGLTFADVDGDGRLDMFVSAISAEGEDPDSIFQYYTGNKLYRNLGDRHFEDVTFVAGVANADWGWGAAFADLDNDGRPDLYVTDGQFVGMWHGKIGNRQFAATPKRLWWRRPDGRFQEVAAAAGITTRASGKGVVVLDADDDGRVDILTVNNGSYPTLERNVTDPAGPWISVQLQGRAPNTAALGAEVRVTGADGRTQVRQAGVGAHFLAQDDPRLHVGLGADGPATVEVRWPDGTTTRRDGVAPGTRLVLDQPAG